jgi:hypothetical protein
MQYGVDLDQLSFGSARISGVDFKTSTKIEMELLALLLIFRSCNSLLTTLLILLLDDHMYLKKS